MKIIRTWDADFENTFREIMDRGGVADEAIVRSVDEIVRAVQEKGDQALFDYTARFDGYALTPETVAVTQEEWQAALSRVAEKDFHLLKLAAERIEDIPSAPGPGRLAR